METPILKVENLTKTYPKQKIPALKDITFEIQANEKVGIIGENGSGKTTLFRLILNLINPDKGKIIILNDPNQESAKRYIGFVPEHQEGLENFTPNELLYLAGKMSKLDKKEIKKRADKLLTWIQLTDYKDTMVSSFSKGMFQRLQFALALIHEPQILILDEPMSGLDPEGQKNLRLLLQNLDNYTVLYASHNLADVEELCNRIIFIHKGKIIKDFRLSEQNLDIFILETEPRALNILNKITNITIRESIKSGNQIKIEILSNHSVFQEFLALCKQKNIEIYRLKSKSILEDLYEKYKKNN